LISDVPPQATVAGLRRRRETGQKNRADNERAESPNHDSSLIGQIAAGGDETRAIYARAKTESNDFFTRRRLDGNRSGVNHEITKNTKDPPWIFVTFVVPPTF
jgi:hypothetical protein